MAAETSEIPFKITNPERIPAKRYYDEAFYKLENERLWTKVWQMAARLDEIPEVGDFTEYKILDKSIIVVRTKSGVKAFANACRHRGVQLASGQGNCKTQGFICPFHGWRFDMDGKNTFVFGRDKFSEENLDTADINLVPVRCETWGGCAFINLDDDALPLLDHFGPSAARLDPRHVERMKVEWWVTIDLPTNWKLAMEAFMEGYHVMKTHPQLQANTTADSANRYGASGGQAPTIKQQMSGKETVDVSVHHMHLLSEGMGGMIHATDCAIAEELKELEWPEDPKEAVPAFFMKLNQEIVSRGRARGVDVPDLIEIMRSPNPISPVEYIFPHYFLLIQFGNASSYRIRPTGPETCCFELWSLTMMPEDEKRERPTPTPVAHNSPDIPSIPQQDYGNLPLQQLGLHASGFDYMRLSKEVEGTISNYQRVIDGYLEGDKSRAQLAHASAESSTGLDSPIKDIGF